MRTPKMLWKRSILTGPMEGLVPVLTVKIYCSLGVISINMPAEASPPSPSGTLTVIRVVNTRA